MRATAVASLVVVAALAAWGTPTPYQGSSDGQGFVLTVVDEDIDAAWELITGAADYTPMSTDTTVRAIYANLSVFDSLRSGNAGVGSLTAIFLGADTGDESANNNFLQSRNTGTVGYQAAVFGNGFSPRWNAYLTRWNDADFQLGQSWAVSCWAVGMSAGNPGVGKVQTVWQLAESPQQARLDFLPGGFISGGITDDGNATRDSVTLAVDLYDSTYHAITFSCATSVLRLDVDNQTRRTKAITAATSRLASVDTLTILGSRGGANDFRGRVDEFYVVEDSTTLDATRRGYIYRAYGRLDTAKVHLSGIRAVDSTHVFRTFTLPFAAAGADTTKLHALEWVWLDSAETQPILIYKTGTSPRQSKLDSIPANLRHEPVAQALFGYNESPQVKSVTFFNYGANAITYELRLYPDVMDSVRFDQQYSVAAAAYVASGGDPVTVEFAGGLRMEPGSYLAGMALGSGANQKGGIIIQGNRRWGR